MKKHATPTHIWLKAEEHEKLDAIQVALSKKLGGTVISKSQAIHVLIAKGYEAMAKELGLK